VNERDEEQGEGGGREEGRGRREEERRERAREGERERGRERGREVPLHCESLPLQVTQHRDHLDIRQHVCRYVCVCVYLFIVYVCM